MTDVYEGLNPVQKQALDRVDGPLLILAGAGSGKTKTLTHRIAHLIANQGVWPNQILAVTFTNKAAREMRQRLWALLEGSSQLQREHSGHTPPRNFMPWMGTFHGICVKLLRLDGGVIGIDKNFVIYDEDDRVSMIKKAMKDLSITDSNIKPKSVSSIISKAKNDLVSANDYKDAADHPYQKSIGSIYGRYEVLRQAAGALDFDDLLIEAVRLLTERDDIRDKWRQTFRYILVDEYQDTNTVQYRLIKLLLNARHNLCVVGDDWQSIYSWRGADFTNILNFERDFPGATVIKLEQNYRSTGAILDAAHRVIRHNRERTDKKLWTDIGEGKPIEIRGVYDEAEEAYTVAQEIMQSGRPFRDHAVLYRMNAQSYAFERALIQARIPYQIIGGVRFYDRREIKDILAYLKLMYQPRDTASFMRIVNVPKRGIGVSTVEKFLAWRTETNLSVLEALAQIDSSPLAKRSRDQLAGFDAIMAKLRSDEQAGVAPSELIARIIELTRYREYVRDGTPQAEDREANIDALVSDARAFASVGDFIEEATLMSSADIATDGDQVTLMTLHAAKGLEFPVVFMVGLEEGVFPHARVLDDNPKDIEEERRLCYVGMTRAREQLYMLYASSRLQFGQRSYGMPSRFLEEAGYEAAAQAPQFTARTPETELDDVLPFDIGDRVASQQFGTGEIIDIDGMAVSVSFDSGVVKKLNAEYARLKKVTT